VAECALDLRKRCAGAAIDRFVTVLGTPLRVLVQIDRDHDQRTIPLRTLLSEAALHPFSALLKRLVDRQTVNPPRPALPRNPVVLLSEPHNRGRLAAHRGANPSRCSAKLGHFLLPAHRRLRTERLDAALKFVEAMFEVREASAPYVRHLVEDVLTVTTGDRDLYARP